MRFELLQNAPQWLESDWPLPFDQTVCEGVLDALDLTRIRYTIVISLSALPPLAAHAWKHVMRHRKGAEQPLAESNDERHTAAIGGLSPEARAYARFDP